MDRSYLSDPAVVEASRGFVCARLISFEDPDEAALMKRLLRGRGLVNTVFAVLDPTGEVPLVTPGRSPRWAYDSGAEMAAALQRVRRQYPGRARVDGGDLGLPLLEDVRIALNVTECDAQQLVVVRGEDREVRRLLARLTELCWSDDLVGRFLYVRADADTDWGAIAGSEDAPTSGLLVVQTDRFGLSGRVVASAPAGAAEKRLRALLTDAAERFRPQPVDTPALRRQGRRKGLRWETEVPVPGKR